MRRSLHGLSLLLVVLASLALVDAATPAFPGANGRIVFVSDRDAGSLGPQSGREIYTAAADGSNPLRLTTNTVGDSEPAYSPDGARIAFTRSNDIWVMNADGSGQVAITGTEGPDSEPAWSADGSQIVYVSNHSTPNGGTTGPELFVRSADGSGLVRQVTNAPSNAVSRAPAWSPAGDQIAYQSNADGGFEIYTIDATATGSFGTRRTPNEVGQNYQNPSWSPDAARIAFERGTGTALDDPSKEIWTMRADGSDLVRLTNNNVNDAQPAYSPDCTLIAYDSNADGDRDVYTRPAAAGGASTNLTSTPAGIADGQPDWGPGGSSAPLCAAPPGGGGPGPLTLADLDDPTLGVDVNVEPVSGTVLVGLRGVAARVAGPGRASQKGIAFVPLSEARQIPVGSFLDTRKGTVRLESAANSAGKRQRGTFLNALFQIRQSRRRSARGLTDLILKGSSFSRCRAGRGKGARAALSRRTIRRLRANAKGRFRTRGRHSSATVRGTVWEMKDRCDGTVTTVRRGKVVVRDFRRRRNITLTAGKSYLARAPG